MIKIESFVSDMHNDNFVIIGNNHYRIECHSKTPTLYINDILIHNNINFNQLVQLSLCIAKAYGDIV